LRARALLGAQAPIEEKTALADVVVDNSGTPEQLEVELDRAWTEVLESYQLSAISSQPDPPE
jgi:dephospho-CoA kinase